MINKKIAPILYGALAIVCFGALVVYIFNHKTKTRVAPVSQVLHFSNGIYAFDYPSTWKAVSTPYKIVDTMFGPRVKTEGSQGSIDVEPSPSLASSVGVLHEQGFDVENIKFFTVDGVEAVTAHVNTHGNGSSYYSAIFYKNGSEYDFQYFPIGDADLQAFEEMIQTFRIVRTDK
jgi:hypothetical protein